MASERRAHKMRPVRRAAATQNESVLQRDAQHSKAEFFAGVDALRGDRPEALTASSVAGLQRGLGNRSIQRLVAREEMRVTEPGRGVSSSEPYIQAAVSGVSGSPQLPTTQTPAEQTSGEQAPEEQAGEAPPAPAEQAQTAVVQAPIPAQQTGILETGGMIPASEASARALEAAGLAEEAAARAREAAALAEETAPTG